MNTTSSPGGAAVPRRPEIQTRRRRVNPPAHRESPGIRQRRNQRALRAALADKRRLEYLRALNMLHPQLSAREIWFIEDLLNRANAARYNYIFKEGERTTTDTLQKQHPL